MDKINLALAESESNSNILHSDAVCILMDIEGTTSSVEFVYDILFPYIRANVCDYLRNHWHVESTLDAIDTIGKDLGYSGSDEWFADVLKTNKNEPSVLQKIIADQVKKMMDEDVKATGLKKLQGLIWDIGYENGALSSHVYEDVPTALKAWKEAGKDLRIYSSGSAQAQKIFFKHTKYGALTNYFSAHYDTTIGSKKDFASYKAIAQDVGISPEKILFLSDISAELDAAKSAGMQVCLVCRPGNAAQQSCSPVIENFLQIRF